MTPSHAPAEADLRFFGLLTAGDSPGLDGLLAEDFLLIDVMTGSEIPRDALLRALASGALVFERIEAQEQRLRSYGDTTVVTGRTRIHGRYLDAPFSTASRYTHVFVRRGAAWKLVAAQGTPIAPAAA